MSGAGLSSVKPSSGKQLWNHPWPCETRIVQPALTADGDILFSSGDKSGMRRLKVVNEANGWKTEEQWMSRRLRPDFNDFVVHKGFAYGFNGQSLACINIANGKRIWKGGRYGGQIILLADQDLLLVLSEKGDLALVEAIPEQYKELANIPAINGKTWNHPALSGEILVVRNTKEMAAFRLKTSGI